jgi:hypothetical protein
MSKDKQQQEKSPKKQEKLTEKEIKQLMSMDKQTYKRKHGAITNR